MLGFHFRKVSRASVGKMVCEERRLDAMFGCVGGALHNSMDAMVSSVVTLTPGRSRHHLMAGIPAGQLSSKLVTDAGPANRCLWAQREGT